MKPSAQINAKTKAQKEKLEKARSNINQVVGNLCYGCGERKSEASFYKSNDPFNKIGYVPFCKICLERIGRNYNERTMEYGDVTKASLCSALERADLPFVNRLWNAAVEDVSNEQNSYTSIYSAYMAKVRIDKDTKSMRWRDGDVFKINTQTADSDDDDYIPSDDIVQEMERNQKDIIRLVGYDPFEAESKADKPLLYAQAIGYLDAGGNNDDQMRVSSIFTIVRGYLQLHKLDNLIAKAMGSVYSTVSAGEVKGYLDAKQKVSNTIAQLAAESCISLKHSKSNTKGENTWTGKIRMMKDMNLREAEVNIFDAQTAQGISQVADISNASIIKQIRLDENDYVKMLTEQKQIIDKLNKEANEAIEQARILLRENLDLKDYIKEQGLDISDFETPDALFNGGDGVGDE